MWDGGFQDYVHDWWNLMDFVMNSLYLATISLKIVAYTKVRRSTTTKVPVVSERRYRWSLNEGPVVSERRYRRSLNEGTGGLWSLNEGTGGL